MPFEYGGQTWPDSTVVTDSVSIEWIPGGSSSELPVKTFMLCFNSRRSGGQYDPGCVPVENIQTLENGHKTGTARMLREAESSSNMWLKVRHGKAPLSLQEARRLTEEEQAAHQEHLIVLSNEVSVHTAPAFVVPEPGVVTGLLFGIAILHLFSKVIRRNTVT